MLVSSDMVRTATFRASSMNTLRWTAVLLLVVVGAIHLYYGAYQAGGFGVI